MTPRKPKEKEPQPQPMEGGTFVKLLTLLLSDVDKYVEPQNNIDDHDIVLGEASDVAKRLYTLWMQHQKSSDQIGLDLKYEENKSEESMAKYSELAGKARIFESLFWCTLNDEHGAWMKPIGIRKGWKVVQVPPKPPGFLKILGFPSDD